MIITNNSIVKININESRLLISSNCPYDQKQKNLKQQSLDNLKDNKTKGILSNKSKTRIKSKISTWCSSTNIYNSQIRSKKMRNLKLFNLITLTLPATQFHTDKEIKRYILMPFIQDLKRCAIQFNYIWVAEKQKNGNIHFHVVTDCYIPYATILNNWNKNLNNLQYIDKYQQKFNNQMPKGVDVRLIKQIVHVAAYVTKYLTKSENQSKIDGRLWGCSTNLENICNFDVDNVAFYHRIKDSFLHLKGLRLQEYDYCSIITFEQGFLHYFKDYLISVDYSKHFLEMSKHLGYSKLANVNYN